MNDEVNTNEELETLKARARLMNIPFSPNIGVESLRKKINAVLATENVEEETDSFELPEVQKKETIDEIRRRVGVLERVRITCMNPNKKEWSGETISIGSAKLGTYKYYVPYNAVWHLPNIIVDHLRDKEFQYFYEEKDKMTGKKFTASKLMREFAIESLPPLTYKELEDLAKRQAMEGTI